MLTLPLRLQPGDDVRGAVVAALLASGHQAGFVLQGIGSLSVAQLRFAGQPQATALHGDLEILTLSGSIAPDGAHLHMSVSDARGQVLGGHVAPPISTPLTKIIGKVGQPVHIFNALRARHMEK